MQCTTPLEAAEPDATVLGVAVLSFSRRGPQGFAITTTCGSFGSAGTPMAAFGALRAEGASLFSFNAQAQEHGPREESER
jgi:hypothetical protein